jgi:plastocyanin
MPMAAPLALLLAAVLTLHPLPAAAQAGSVEGTVTRRAAATRVADRYAERAAAAHSLQAVPTVAFIEGAVAGGGTLTAAGRTLAQQDTAFAPSLVIVPVGATVEFPNRDPFFHNVFSYSRTRRFDLGRYPRGESKSVAFDAPGVVSVFCEIHRGMRATVVVVENPHVTTVDRDGRFTLRGVPPGRHTLVVVDPDRGRRAVPVVVSPGAATRVSIAY